MNGCADNRVYDRPRRHPATNTANRTNGPPTRLTTDRDDLNTEGRAIGTIARQLRPHGVRAAITAPISRYRASAASWMPLDADDQPDSDGAQEIARNFVSCAIASQTKAPGTWRHPRGNETRPASPSRRRAVGSRAARSPRSARTAHSYQQQRPRGHSRNNARSRITGSGTRSGRAAGRRRSRTRRG